MLISRPGKPKPDKWQHDQCKAEGCQMAADGMNRCDPGKCIDGLSLRARGRTPEGSSE